MSRTLFIGDIHGCYDELVALYEKMNVAEGDTVYSTGDIINSGPKSFEVIEFCLEKNIKPVFGNHEFYFFKYIENESPDKKIQPLFDELYKKLSDFPERLAWLKNLPKYIETENFLLVHAGLKPHIPFQEQSFEDMITIREFEGKPWHDFYTGEKIIIYGHWAQQGLRFTGNTRGLDSGCLWGGHLTGYCLETGEIWQVRANEIYKKPDHWREGDKN